MNRKGQAMVEFVLILPIFVLILFAIIDFGNIFYKKYELQNQSSDIVRLINNNQNLKEIYPTIEINITNYKEEYQKITLKKKVDLVTPFLNKIMGNPYIIEVERIIPNEET